MTYTNEQNYSTQERSTDEPASETESGEGGGDMDIWSGTRIDKLSTIAAGTYTNASSFTIPAGYSKVRGYNQSLGTNAEKPLTELSADASNGEGGGDMDIWSKSRTEKLSTIGAGTYVNKSAFSIPAGYSSVRGYNETLGNDAEKFQAVSITGSALDPDALPLAGTVKIVTRDGQTLSTRGVEGGFIASGSPFQAITQGSDLGGIPTIDSIFTPNQDGVSSEIQDIDYPLGSTLSASYGFLSGTVLDVNGDPVSGVIVRGGGASTLSDSSGNYQLLAPGGDVTLTSIDGTLTKDVTVVSQDTVTADWQYGGVTVTVVGPQGEGVPNASVDFNGERYITDDSGSVNVPVVPIGTFTLTILEDFQEDIEVSVEGQLVRYDVAGANKLQVTCVDKDTGRPISDVDSIEDNRGTRINSTSSGALNIIAVGANNYRVFVGQNDRRYSVALVEDEVPDGDIKSVTAELKRQREYLNSG